jgi:hypothetical protein
MNPNYCTIEEARATAAKLKDIGGGVKAIYLPQSGGPQPTITDPQHREQTEHRQYLFIFQNGNTETPAGMWAYLFSRMPAWMARMFYGGTVEPGNGKPVVGVSWQEEYRA